MDRRALYFKDGGCLALGYGWVFYGYYRIGGRFSARLDEYQDLSYMGCCGAMAVWITLGWRYGFGGASRIDIVLVVAHI